MLVGGVDVEYRRKDSSIAGDKVWMIDFHESYSIKAVLPAILKNMSYKNLAIQNGDVAIAIFGKLAKETLPREENNLLRQ